MKLCLLRIRANSTIPKKIPTTSPPTPATIGHMKSGESGASVLNGSVTTTGEKGVNINKSSNKI